MTHDNETRVRAADLLSQGIGLSATSRLLGVSRSTLRSWAATSRAAPSCPLPNPPAAPYAALLGYYLGDGCLSQQPRTWALRVSCDPRFPGIVHDVADCVELVHPERRTYRVAAPGTVVVQSYWKHWPCLFPQHGPGRKHERPLTLAPWQRGIVESYPVDFLRGLFHSDGCLVRNWATRRVAGEMKRYAYPRWQFVNESPDIMRWCGESLDLVGIRYRQTKPRVLSVSRRADVARLTALIGEKG